jgi:uncharacterized protein (TIGR01777 family)
MKKIVISGGSGLIGSKLADLFVQSGYEVNILTRNSSKFIDSDNIKYRKFDINSIENTAKILEGAFSIINLAGAPIADSKWTTSYKQEIYNSRINMTNHLVNAVNSLENPPKSFISASAIGIYGNRGDEKLTESSHIGSGFLTDVCRDWEYEADKCNAKVRLVKARIGIVLAENGGALSKLAMATKWFAGGPIGNGNQWMSWIHIDDLAALFLWSIENSDVNGIFNFVSPNPVTMNEFAKTLGKTLHRPSFFRVPEFVIKLILGESAIIVLDSQKVYPATAEHLSFQYKYKFLKDALINLLK